VPGGVSGRGGGSRRATGGCMVAEKGRSVAGRRGVGCRGVGGLGGGPSRRIFAGSRSNRSKVAFIRNYMTMPTFILTSSARTAS
jgi:hypothetical protein